MKQATKLGRAVIFPTDKSAKFWVDTCELSGMHGEHVANNEVITKKEKEQEISYRLAEWTYQHVSEGHRTLQKPLPTR